MSDQILMEHPDLGPDRQQPTTLKAFNSVWKNEGWVLVDAPEEQVDFQELEDLANLGEEE